MRQGFFGSALRTAVRKRKMTLINKKDFAYAEK